MAVTPSGIFQTRNTPATIVQGFPFMYQDESQNFKLQSTISAATSGLSPDVVPHHPITCTGKLEYDENGIFSCEHSEVPLNDPRTHACLIHSLAVLIIEEAYHFTELKELPYDGTITTESA